MPRLTVAVVARSELFGCGAMAALDAFGVATRLVLVRGPGLRAEDLALDADVAVLEWNEPNRNAWDQLRALHAANELVPAKRLRQAVALDDEKNSLLHGGKPTLT